MKPLKIEAFSPLAIITAEFGLQRASLRLPATCPAVDIRRPAVAVGGRQRGGAREHIDSTVAADRGRKDVVGGRGLKLIVPVPAPNATPRRSERAGCSRRIARARTDVECSNWNRRYSRSQ